MGQAPDAGADLSSSPRPSVAVSPSRRGLRAVPQRDRRGDASMMAKPFPECNAGLAVGTPCMTAFWRFSSYGPRPLTGAQSRSVSEQVAEAQRVRDLQERRIVLGVGQHALLPPAPRGLGMDVETAVHLRPRQAELLLEPHQPLREVVGEDVDYSAVVGALSRHRADPPRVCVTSLSGGSVLAVRHPARWSLPSGHSQKARANPLQSRPPPLRDIHGYGLFRCPSPCLMARPNGDARLRYYRNSLA